MRSKTVCLIGGSGFVGRHVANLLCSQGLSVRIPTRRRELVKSDLIVLPTAEVIEADIGDPQVLSESIAGCDAVINLTGILHETTKGDFQRVHSESGARCTERIFAFKGRRRATDSRRRSKHGADDNFPAICDFWPR
jgi:NADH dehydrogenase